MNDYFVILICLISSAFFSGLEIAFLTSNKLRIELESNQGFYPSKILSYFIKKPSQFIATTLVGNNIALVVYGIYMAKILEPYIEIFVHSKFGVLAIDVTLATILVVITAEFLPKALFRINPNGILTFFSVPFAIVYVLLFPVVFITIGLSELLLQKVFRFSLNKDQIVFGRVDLDSYIKQFTSIRDESKQFDHEITIFQNALDFGSVKVRDCMIPRNEIVGIDSDSDIKELKEKFIETHLSKIIIYKENLDNVIGYVHSNELFKKPQNIKEVLRPIAIIPETMHAKETLTQLKKERKSIAVVVDEFGGTSGLVTIEDLMEEIFGEIDDEHDKEEMTEQKISNLLYLFSGRLEIDYLNQKYKFNLPSSDSYETLAGLFINYFSSIPQKDEQITIDGFQLKVVAVEGTRIEKIELMKLDS
ncbi:MAG: hemolysin family protein [Bacteroidota bacterium]|jgi:putative hemolysin